MNIRLFSDFYDYYDYMFDLVGLPYRRYVQTCEYSRWQALSHLELDLGLSVPRFLVALAALSVV